MFKAHSKGQLVGKISNEDLWNEVNPEAIHVFLENLYELVTL